MKSGSLGFVELASLAPPSPDQTMSLYVWVNAGSSGQVGSEFLSDWMRPWNSDSSFLQVAASLTSDASYSLRPAITLSICWAADAFCCWLLNSVLTWPSIESRRDWQ